MPILDLLVYKGHPKVTKRTHFRQWIRQTKEFLVQIQNPHTDIQGIQRLLHFIRRGVYPELKAPKKKKKKEK